MARCPDFPRWLQPPVSTKGRSVKRDGHLIVPLTVRIKWWAWPVMFIRVLRQNHVPWWMYMLIPSALVRSLMQAKPESKDVVLPDD